MRESRTPVQSSLYNAGRIRTCDLRVMSPTSYLTATTACRYFYYVLMLGVLMLDSTRPTVSANASHRSPYRNLVNQNLLASRHRSGMFSTYIHYEPGLHEREDLNPHKQVWNLLCYHYTTPIGYQSVARLPKRQGGYI